MIQVIMTLANLARKLKAVGIIIDAERMKPEERFKSILNSFKAKYGKEAIEILRKENPFIVSVRGRRFIIFVSCIDYPFEVHAIDDYFVCILLKMGRIDEKELRNYKSGKELLKSKNITFDELLALEKEIKLECFKELIDFIKLLMSA